MIILIIFILNLGDELIFETEKRLDLEIILKDIENLRNNPVDINTASIEDLSRIPYLSINDCIKIIDHRERYGFFNDPRDLLKISGFEEALLERIEPFITVGIKKVKIEKLNLRMRLRSEIPKKDKSEEYYTKSNLLVNQYNVFLLTEKDPYENSFFDHYATGIMIDEGKRKFAVGKYNLDLGAGVVLSPIGSFFQGIDFRMMTTDRGIIPYTSAIENGGFFGAALSDSLFLNYSIFYSNQKLDGGLDSLGFARSFDESGEHIDSIALSKKDRINEEIFGYDIRYNFPNVHIAHRSYWCGYEPAFASTDSFAKFYGEKFFVSGIEAKYFGDFFVIFTEAAKSWKNRVGGIFGFSGIFPYVDFNLAAKYFPDGYYSPKGIESADDYIGGILDIRHDSKIGHIGLTLTLDNKVEVDSTKYGLKLSFGKLIGILDARLQIRWRYKEETKDLSGSRIFLRVRPMKPLFFDLRLEEKYVRTLDQLEKGLYGSLEAGLDFKKIDLRLRYGQFNTESYAARIYAYEIDLPGIINNRMLYNEGDYGYIYIAYKPAKFLKVNLKYAIVKRDTLSMKQLGAQLDVKL